MYYEESQIVELAFKVEAIFSLIPYLDEFKLKLFYPSITKAYPLYLNMINDIEYLAIFYLILILRKLFVGDIDPPLLIMNFKEIN